MKILPSRSFVIAIVIGALSAVAASGQSFAQLWNFDGTNGANPGHMSLVQGGDGNLYGTTFFGGANGFGTVFKIGLRGFETLHSFDFTDGESPFGLVYGTDGNLYGVTQEGGAFGFGTAFKMSPSGVLSTIYNFCSQSGCTDGQYPMSALVQGSDGNLYGTTYQGGNGVSYGTIFKLTPAGVLTILHRFGGTDGDLPLSPLIQAADGSFYGTTSAGGTANWGTVFKITLQGQFSTLYNFCSMPNCADGALSQAALTQWSDGNLYGTTSYGGLAGQGTIFKITTQGHITSIYSFCFQANCLDGSYPAAALVRATDGALYGTTEFGGMGCSTSGCGVLFRLLLPQEAFKPIYYFPGPPSNGTFPFGLTQATNGIFYGTTYGGGTFNTCGGYEGQNGCGTIFSLDMGLGPFVAFVRNPTRVGQIFGILGQGLTGATNISLNGSPAPFTVRSDTLITATVPAGATTGPVTVTTLTGTLTSNVPFRVLPQLLNFTPTSGPVGTQVTITGVSLTQTTGVGFGNYTPAQFTVNSDTQVTATVPSGAQTGPVGIQTQGGTAISTQTFTVTQ